MKLIVALLICIWTFCFGCNDNESKFETDNKFVQTSIAEENLTPTVDIDHFVLISNNTEAQIKDAKEILKVKRNFPLAMQTKDESLFNKILAKNFAFRAEDEFYNRADYIKDRTTCTDTVTAVKYENLVLQFFGDIGVLTYRNIVENKGILHDTIAMDKNWNEYMTWADIYVKEEGIWKIGSVHQIEYRADVK
ncbi:MAG: nuclear transport factor 2 family protein [Saprospiraceae bacterium]|nr:nuclear transport factor 2 family protein [Saprospiraceae bacterium]MBK7912684.1 nuclear transport factor 2 family protein [Saprospiraceae bacterium]